MLLLVAWFLALWCLDGTWGTLRWGVVVAAAAVVDGGVVVGVVSSIPVFDVREEVCSGLAVYAWQ